ncbi:conserved Plasmodium protein, unknown function [Plasmodium ovale wallikeri]|uniref:Immune mapped protein 2 N-terminal domain-containing protein n=1 Tax=Plasmodium ovale wallikeri TaxID=864142 RepID=A0A1A8YSP5_PLAOA|nr:conserved Plasmodium protein, unknown function [Plasmodium ovale wallikeri]SBT34457.1 conserved Plasmodium protein, unknown function [Plasmodium ovale wallikeri]
MNIGRKERSRRENKKEEQQDGQHDGRRGSPHPAAAPKKSSSRRKIDGKSKNDMNKNEKTSKNNPDRENNGKRKKEEEYKLNETIRKNSTQKENVINRRGEIAKRENYEREKTNCFLCFCCGNNEDEKNSELLLQDEKQKERDEEEERERRKREEEKEEEERERRKREEEEEEERERRKREEEEEREKEKKMRMDADMIDMPRGSESIPVDMEDERKKRGTLVMNKDVKAKIFAKKKAKLNFLGAAAAPSPPGKEACEGNPPVTKKTSVPIQDGIYLIYNPENNGQLEIHYSKHAKEGSGVLAYIQSMSIPEFYFDINRKKEVLLTDVSRKMQSIYVNDLKPYYQSLIEFIKLKRKFNGVLYFLPAFDAQPPPKLDVIFFDMKGKQVRSPRLLLSVRFLGEDRMSFPPFANHSLQERKATFPACTN